MLLSALIIPFICALAPVSLRADSPRIVALGDSLTSGRGIDKKSAFPAVLEERLRTAGFDYDVVNAGVSGDTTARALRRYRDALDGDVRVLILALGANDGLRGVPVRQLKANLSEIIEAAQRRKIDVILVGMDALPINGWDYSVAFHKAYEELAATYHVPLVPFILPKVMMDSSLMQRDRAHPNEDGAQVIADTIWPYLEKVLVRLPAPSAVEGKPDTTTEPKPDTTTEPAIRRPASDSTDGGTTRRR
jgi:acyl-CoA thioesterase-1